jgi:hypothetical protein
MSKSKLACVVVAFVFVIAGAAWAQTSTTVQQAEVEILYVHGNTVAFQLGDEVMERTVPADFRVMVDGKPTPVSELVPGQKVMIEKTTTTTVVPATKVVKIRDGEVINAGGNSLMYKENDQVKTITVPADYKFIVNGQPVGLWKLHKGDKLTATVVTETPGSTTTTSHVRAAAKAPKPAEPAPAPAAAAPAAAPAAEPAPAPKMPKTASQLPLLGLAGSLLLALGAGLALVRRLS